MFRMSKFSSMIVAGAWLGVVSAAAAAQPGAVEDLVPEREMRREILGGRTHIYRLGVAAGDLLEIGVDQRGRDVALRLVGPAGDELLAVDGRYGPVGTERVLWVADAAGLHVLEIEAFPSTAPVGEYVLRWARPRPADALDRRRVAALRASLEAASRHGAEALRAQGEVLEQRLVLGDPVGVAEARIALGRTQVDRDDPVSARAEFAEVAASADAETVQRAYAHGWLGELEYRRFHDPAAAVVHLEKAVELWASVPGGDEQVALASHLRGQVHAALDEISEALDAFGLALQKARAGHLETLEPTIWFSRAKVKHQLGRWDEAAADFRRALEIEERLGRSEEVAVVAVQLSFVEARRGRFDDAFDLLGRAIPLTQSDRRGRAIADGALGWTHHQAWRGDDPSGRRMAAHAAYDAALRSFDALGDRIGAARIRYLLGLLLLDEEQSGAALEQFDAALNAFPETERRGDRAEVLHARALAHRALGDLDAAVADAERALVIVEALREAPEPGELRALVVASRRHVYDLFIELCLELHVLEPEAGHDVAAFEVSEGARGRALLETLEAGRVELGERLDPALRAERRELRRGLASAHYRLRREPGDVESRAASLRLEQALRGVEQRIRVADPRAALLDGSRRRLAEIRRDILDDDTALLEYHLGAHGGVLWVVTRDALHTHLLSDREGLEESARQVHGMLRGGLQRDHFSRLEWHLGELGSWLVEPVAEEIAGKRLVVVPDGALHYVPFAALSTGVLVEHGAPRRLIEDHEIVVLPSASALGVLRGLERPASAGERRVVAFADPVFGQDDERLEETACAPTGASRWPRLPHTRDEAEAIRAHDPSAVLVSGLGARKEVALGELLERSSHIHLATHASFDASAPERSALIFSLFDRRGCPIDGSLSLPQIYDLRLSAELVVLSACDTALGEEIRGEGLVGLTQGFLYAGAERVVAGLWSVDDDSTAELMGHFYDHLFDRGLSPAAALRSAQLDMLHQPRELWREPQHWAGFLVQGDF